MRADCPLSIVIVSWNTRDLLAACLCSLAARGGMLDGAEVIVVDNASTDDSRQYLRDSCSWVRLIENPANSGFAAATNQGLAAAAGRFLLLLNSDTEVRPGALTAMASFLSEHARIGIIGADVRNPDGSPQPCAGGAPSLLSETVSVLGLDRRMRSLAALRRDVPQPGAFIPWDWVLGAALMIRRETYDQIGLLDTGYYFYSEEVDWCVRARKCGWEVGTLVGAEVMHHGGGSTRRTSDRMRPALFRSKIRYLAIHEGRRSARLFRAVVRMVAGLHIMSARVRQGRARQEEASWIAVRQSV
jgi:N-acetylglucosaminyl-diphospho-decaprenol L-rhamnosyltransferase